MMRNQKLLYAGEQLAEQTEPVVGQATGHEKCTHIYPCPIGDLIYLSEIMVCNKISMARQK